MTPNCTEPTCLALIKWILELQHEPIRITDKESQIFKISPKLKSENKKWSISI